MGSEERNILRNVALQEIGYKKPKRYSAAYIIAFHFCSDVADVQSGRYQPTRYNSPSIYVISDDYYCCPEAGKAPPIKFGKWEEIGEHYGRKVYKCAAF